MTAVSILRASSVSGVFRRHAIHALHTSTVRLAAAEPMHNFGVGVAAAVTERSPPTVPPASVPFMITSAQRLKLYDLDYTREDVDALSPSDALTILSNSLSRDAYDAHVRATWQPKKPQVAIELPDVICLGGDIVGGTAAEGKQPQQQQPPTTASTESPSPLRSPSSSSQSHHHRYQHRHHHENF